MLDTTRTPEQVVRDLAARMSLRLPQERSLEILADVADRLKLDKDTDIEAALRAIKSDYPEFGDFEGRDFPSLCFALATGVGKTRLLGAFIAFLYMTGRSKNFFVLAPNTTIYQKLVDDLTLGTRKYVFKGISAFAQNQPVVVTGETWDQSSIFVEAARRNGGAVINVFNVDKINKDGGRVKKLNEYVGDSYFNFLAGLPDLVLIMDEAHRYRAKAALKAVTDLKPVLGLELTATPKSVGAKAVEFRNVIYRFDLGEAMEHGYVKEPAVATRKDFDPKSVTPERLEAIKLEDGIHAHEYVRLELEKYATETGRPSVRPFMLVVAQDTNHARRIRETIQSDGFFGGYYKDRVIQVDSSGKSKEESDEITERLLKLETDGSTEIVIHVNMLKEGWDVTNLFTIVPLRASASDILTEQTLGRGLRLPYGERTKVEAIDRLTVIAHDRFSEVIEKAKEPGSVVASMKAVVIGEGGDIATTGSTLVQAPSRIEAVLTGETGGFGERPQEPFAFETQEERTVAKVTLDVIHAMEREFKTLDDLHKPEVQAKIAARVETIAKPVQGVLAGVTGPGPDIKAVVEKVATTVTAGTIAIPQIVVLPDSSVTYTFRDFDLAGLDKVGVRPMASEITLQELRTERRSFIKLMNGGAARQERLEDYLVSALFVFDEIDYDAHADLLYKLAGQVVARLRVYLETEDQVETALIQHARSLAETVIFPQMMQHYEETPTTFRVRIERGFQSLKAQNLSNPTGKPLQHYKVPVRPLAETRRYAFHGFKKCCYLQQSFQSDSERRFAVLIDADHETEVLRWVKPGRNQFQIDYRRGEQYEPDFVVETTNETLICEIKARDEMADPTVQAKAEAARTWVWYANVHARENGGKPWRYALIPHDAVTDNASFAGLVATWSLDPLQGRALAA